MSNKKVRSTSMVGVGLVHKTLQILDLFQPDHSSWSLNEMVKVTGIPKSTIHRLVRFLTDRGYLALLEERHRYTLGPASIDLGWRAWSSFDFREFCRPSLQRLAFQTQETVLLTSVVGSGNAVRCVDQIESTREGLRVFEKIGAIFPLHAGAAPKAVLAFLSDEDRHQYIAGSLEAITDTTIVDPKELSRDLQNIRSRGYSISWEETYEGVAGVGTPFFWSDGRPAGSMAIAVPIQRATSETIKTFGCLLRDACARIDERLSQYSPQSALEKLSA